MLNHYPSHPLLQGALIGALGLTLISSASCTPEPDAMPDAMPDSEVLDAALEAEAGRPDARIRDAVVPDANPCEPLSYCGVVCVNLDDDPNHCGECNRTCDTPENAGAQCTSGVCSFRCLPGFDASGGACVPAPRLIWPPSLSTIYSRRPPFVWTRPGASGSADLQICSDARCLEPLFTTSVGGDMARPLASLPSGSLYWRVLSGDLSSEIWSFTMGPLPSGRESASGTRPDFNGDGLGDLVIGAPDTGMSMGRVFVHYGGDGGPASRADMTLWSPDGSGARFGAALTAAGDLNGDGFADLAVASPEADSQRGRVHVYLGSREGIRSAPSLTIEGRSEGSRFGLGLSGAGDVNRDGFSDLLVSAPGIAGRSGEVLVFHGSAMGLDTPAIQILTGEDLFGSSTTAAGDINADGYSDILIGSPSSGESGGEVQVYLGSATGVADTPNQTLAGMTGSEFGAALAGLGDVNGDGYSDIAVGAPAAEMSRGQVLVYHGSSAGLGEAPALTLTGSDGAEGFFGQAVAGLGDVNGDGRSELAVGSYGVMDDAGQITVFVSEAAGIRASPGTTIEGPAGMGGRFGWSLAGLTDVDGDGLGDLAVGAPMTADGQGSVYIYPGHAMQGIRNPAIRSINSMTRAALGHALAGSQR